MKYLEKVKELNKEINEKLYEKQKFIAQTIRKLLPAGEQFSTSANWEYDDQGGNYRCINQDLICWEIYNPSTLEFKHIDELSSEERQPYLDIIELFFNLDEEQQEDYIDDEDVIINDQTLNRII